METPELDRALREAIEQRTLSLEASEALAQLREDYKRALDRVDELCDEADAARAKHKELLDERNKLAEAANDMASREKNVAEREMKCLRTEVENEFHDKAYNNLTVILNNLTRNTEYRRTVFDNKAGQPGPDGTYTNETSNIDETSRAE